MSKENTEQTNITEFPQAEDDNNLVMKLKKPYKFEGKEYTEIDLSKMEDMNTADLIGIGGEVGRTSSNSLLPEITLEYAIHIAARATGLPIEFFELLPMKEGVNLRAAVTHFFIA